VKPPARRFFNAKEGANVGQSSSGRRLSIPPDFNDRTIFRVNTPYNSLVNRDYGHTDRRGVTALNNLIERMRRDENMRSYRGSEITVEYWQPRRKRVRDNNRFTFRL
jgi:hypothetical protein